jgi:hypothetical protein
MEPLEWGEEFERRCKIENSWRVRRLIHGYAPVVIVRDEQTNSNPLTQYAFVSAGDVEKYGVNWLLTAIVYRAFLRRLEKWGIYANVLNRRALRRSFVRALSIVK